MDYGVTSMTAPLRRVAVRPPAPASDFARAHWAHLNGIEAFPPFAAAVIVAQLVHDGWLQLNDSDDTVVYSLPAAVDASGHEVGGDDHRLRQVGDPRDDLRLIERPWKFDAAFFQVITGAKHWPS